MDKKIENEDDKSIFILFIKDIFGAFLAGMLVSMACVGNMLCENKYVGAAMFSFAILACMQYKLSLFTGCVGKVHNIGEFIVTWLYFILNLLGCKFMYVIIYSIPRIYEKIAPTMNSLVAEKMSIRPYTLLLLGFLCGIVIDIGTSNRKNKILTVLCIMIFVLSGFEHSIADGFYFMELKYGFFRTASLLFPIAVGNSLGALFTHTCICIK